MFRTIALQRNTKRWMCVCQQQFVLNISISQVLGQRCRIWHHRNANPADRILNCHLQACDRAKDFPLKEKLACAQFLSL